MTSDAESGELIATFKITGHGDHQMRGPVTIGRDPRADDGDIVEVDGDPLVSKSHLCIDIDQGDLIITDLGSSNGTYLHHAAGEIAVPSDRWIPIPAGAEIEFGDQRLTIERTARVVTADPGVDPGSSPEDAPDEASDEAATVEHVAPAAQQVAPTPTAAATPAAEPLAAEVVECSQCHRELPPGSKFCDGCGKPVMPRSAPAPAADDPGRTVVIPPGGVLAANPTPAPRSAGPPAPPAAHPPAPAAAHPPAPAAAHPPAPPAAQPAGRYGGAPSQYGATPAGPTTQGPPLGQYGQSPPPPQPHGVPGAPPQPRGGPVFVDPTAASSSTGGAGKKILLGIGALVVLGLIGFGLVAVLGGEDDSTASGRGIAQSIPTELDELWSTDVNGTSGFPGVGDAAVYVASESEMDILFTSLARGDGDENWETTIDDADFGSLVGEFDDVTVVSVCTFDAEVVCSVIGLDIEDGDEIWREPIADGFASASAGNLLVDDGEGLILLDPATGDRLERVRGEVEFSDFNALLLDDDGDVSAYDDDLQPLIGPVEIDDDATDVTFDGERLLVPIGDEIEYVDSSGEFTPGPFLDGEITTLIAVDDSTVVAELGDEVVVYDIDGDDAAERWSESGTIGRVLSPDDGAVVIVDTGTDQLIIDLASGDERFEVDGSVEDGVSTVAASNGLVVVDRGDIDNFEGVATVTAYDWTTGDEIWSEDIEGAVRVDDVVVVVETDGDVVVFG